MAAAQNIEAAAIAKRLLDITGHCIMSGDAEGFADNFVLPQSIATVDGAVMMETRSDLVRSFNSMSGYLAANGITRIEREVELALFDGPDTIRHAYFSRFYRDDSLARPAFPNHSVLRRFGDEWKIVSTLYSFSDRPDHSQALLGAIGEAPSVAINNGTLTGSNVTDIVQNQLERLTAAYLSGQFENARDLVKLPLFMQLSDHTRLLETEADLQNDFNQYVREYSLSGITDIIRTVKSADMLGATRIHGIYRSYVLADKELARPSYTSAVTLDQGDDKRWRITAVLHPMGHRVREAWTDRSPGSPDPNGEA